MRAHTQHTHTHTHTHTRARAQDLFFLNVLYNRVEMATLFWEKSSLSPVRTAITAAYMLHEMANTDGIEPAVKMSMLDNAKHFETKAIGVMKAAQKTNRQLATLALDCPLKMWTDMTLLDVAVKGECNQFVEECCREAIDARMYGDLDPYQNSLPWIFFNVFPLFGIWAAIGAYFPWLEGQSFGLNDVLFRPLVKFKLPPESDVLRGSTQRRLRPTGYPNRPNDNELLGKQFLVPRCDAVRMWCACSMTSFVDHSCLQSVFLHVRLFVHTCGHINLCTRLRANDRVHYAAFGACRRLGARCVWHIC